MLVSVSAAAWLESPHDRGADFQISQLDVTPTVCIFDCCCTRACTLAIPLHTAAARGVLCEVRSNPDAKQRQPWAALLNKPLMPHRAGAHPCPWQRRWSASPPRRRSWRPGCHAAATAPRTRGDRMHALLGLAQVWGTADAKLNSSVIAASCGVWPHAATKRQWSCRAA